MAGETLNCWNCGSSLADMPLPLGRREICPRCDASLHVCRLCQFYDPGTSKDCREPVADEVADKEAANFCDFFRPKGGISASEDRSVSESRSKLAALFGGDSPPAGKPAPSGKEEPGGGEAEQARRKLESLFGGGKD